MTSRSYLYSAFPGAIDAGQLYNIVLNSAISVSLHDVDDNGTQITFNFNSTLTGGDITLLNAIVAGFTPIYGDGSNCWVYAHTATAATDGGSMTGSVWNTRTINTTIHQNGFDVQLSSNQLKMYPGTYTIRASWLSNGIGHNMVRVRDITHGATLCGGLSDNTTSGVISLVLTNFNSTSSFTDTFTITSYSTIEFQQYAGVSVSGSGMGNANTSGLANKYLQIHITN